MWSADVDGDGDSLPSRKGLGCGRVGRLHAFAEVEIAVCSGLCGLLPELDRAVDVAAGDGEKLAAASGAHGGTGDARVGGGDHTVGKNGGGEGGEGSEGCETSHLETRRVGIGWSFMS